MKAQNYNNHRRYYAPHHFIFLPIIAGLQILGVWKYFNDKENALIWLLFSVIIFLIIYLTVMVRQHYALENQNRIIRLEFQQRYFEIFGERSDQVIKQLRFSQIAALRFAYDEEFKALLAQALNKDISGDEIKKSIKDWRPDYHRV
ncbi:MAG: hypothetical protein KA289_01125 [Kaistella sp.]|nr:hypothetical protein [Kaistella sp.]